MDYLRLLLRACQQLKMGHVGHMANNGGEVVSVTLFMGGATFNCWTIDLITYRCSVRGEDTDDKEWPGKRHYCDFPEVVKYLVSYLDAFYGSQGKGTLLGLNLLCLQESGVAA